MKVDLHVHTIYSSDSLTTLSNVLRWAERRHMGALAITDHNTIRGACALAQISPIPIIVGEEILTRRGEIIGLFLQEEIPSNLDHIETVRLIHQQGGLAYVPHPMDRIRRSTIDLQALMEVIDEVGEIEAMNARVTFPIDNQRAEALARGRRLLLGAGSDAHQGFEIGRAYVEMPAFTDAPSFLQSLAQGQTYGHISSPLVHVGSTYAKVAKEFIALTL